MKKNSENQNEISFSCHNKDQIYTVNTSDLMNPLGTGAFGKVFKASCNGQAYAIKQINKSSIDSKYIEQESKIMKENEKHVGNIMYSLAFTTDNNYAYILMPYMEKGSLYSIIQNNGVKSESEAIEYFRQICYGVDILHTHSIIHRDLKTRNILCTKSIDPTYPLPYLMCVSDFGISKEMISANNTQSVGTPSTQAPEVPSGIYDFKADVYSLGCVFYEMLTRESLFGGKVKKEDASFTLQQAVSNISLKILEGCLQYDPENRFTLDELNELIDFRKIYTNYYPISKYTIDTIDMKKRTLNKKGCHLKSVATINSSVTKLGLCVGKSNKIFCKFAQQLIAQDCKVFSMPQSYFSTISTEIMQKKNRHNQCWPCRDSIMWKKPYDSIEMSQVQYYGDCNPDEENKIPEVIKPKECDKNNCGRRKLVLHSCHGNFY